MAEEFLTLADLITINDHNLADLEVTDLLNRAPVLAMLPAGPASNGTTHKYTKEIGAPVVGFRQIGKGRDNSKSRDVLVSISLEILDASFAYDIELGKAYKRGRDAYRMRETMRHMREGMFVAEQQIWYGKGNDDIGFVGLGDNDGLKHKNAEMVVDAGGSTANKASSVWLFVVEPDDTGVMVIGGNDGNIEIEDPVLQRVEEKDGGSLPMEYIAASGYLGLQVGSRHDVVRIANLTAQAGKGLTDDLIAQAIELIPAHKRANLRLAMNRQSQRQLQQSRTPTTQSATGAPAPFPTESHNVEITVTDSLSKTEAILPASA